MTDLLAKADIVIVGAGVMGASTAFQLCKLSNKTVIIVDQFGPLGGMSGRSFGQVRLHYSNSLTLKMAKFGIDHFANWHAEVGFGSAGYVPLGYLLTATSAQFAAAKRNVALAQSIGIKTRFIDPDEIKAIEPAINIDGLEGAAWDPAGGYIDVTKIVLGYLTAAGLSGAVTVMGDTKAQRILHGDNGVSGVMTNRGLIQVDQVIVANGPWAPGLLDPLGLSVPVEARRLDTMYMHLPKGAPQIRRCITDGTANIVIRPDFGPTILAAAYPPVMELVNDPLITPTRASDADHVDRINTAIAARFPGLAGATAGASVSGSYDITPDWHPILGPVPDLPGLLLATGFSGHGLKLAPAVGRALAQIAIGTDPDFDIYPLRLSRFAENDPMYLAYGPGGRA